MLPRLFNRKPKPTRSELRVQKNLETLKSEQSILTVSITQKSRRDGSETRQSIFYTDSYEVKGQPDQLLDHASFRIFESYNKILRYASNYKGTKTTMERPFDPKEFEWRYNFSIDSLYGIGGNGSSGPLNSARSLLNSFNIFRNNLPKTLDCELIKMNYLIEMTEDKRREVMNSLSSSEMGFLEKAPKTAEEYVNSALNSKMMEEYFDKNGEYLLRLSNLTEA